MRLFRKKNKKEKGDKSKDKNKEKKRDWKGLKYIIISFFLWIIVEFITVWHSRFAEWISHMPWVLFQYLFIIIVFWFVLYKRNWNYRKVFILMIVLMYIFEFLWMNFLLLNPILFIPGSLLLISLWGFLTFIPYWFLNKELKKHKKSVIIYLLWVLLVLFLLLLNALG